MRQDWEKKTIPLFTGQDLTNYNLDTTNGFKISNPSTSTATMSRIVNAIPYKHDEKFKWKKRPGCLSYTSLNNATTASGTNGGLGGVHDAFLTSGEYLLIGGTAKTGALPQLVYTTTGENVVQIGPPRYATGGDSITAGVQGTGPLVNLSETRISNTNYLLCHNGYNTTTFVPLATGTSTLGFYAKETDLVSGSGDYAIMGTCAVTNGSAVITGISSTAMMKAGQTINIGFTDGSVVNFLGYIVSVDSGTQITFSSNITGGYTGAGYFSKGALYKIIDTDFPGNNSLPVIGNFVALNGYIYIMTVSGSIYNSDINDPSAWQATGNIAAQMLPDTGRGLFLYKNHIMAFGLYSIEFFRDVGNAVGSPLQSVPELFIKLGIRQPKHAVGIEDTLCFIGNSDLGNNSVYLMEGFQAKRISTDDIDYVISKIGPANFEIKALRLNGKMFILVNRQATTSSQEYITFVYSLEDNLWFEWKVTEAGTSTDYTHPWQFPGGVISSVFYSASPYQATNGAYITKFLAESDTNYYDNLSASSKPVTFYLQSKILDGGTGDRKFHSRLYLNHTTDTAFTIGTDLNLYKSDDFGQTWVTRAFATTISFLSNLGAFKKRIFRLVENSTNFYQFFDAEIKYVKGNK